MTRLGTWLRWALLTAVAAALVLGGILLWLLHSAGGRDWLLQQAAAGLPAGSTLQWRAAQGTLAGPLTLQNVQLRLPMQRDADCVPHPKVPCATGTLQVTAQTLTLDPALLPLLGRRLRLDALTLRNVRIDLPRSDTAFKLPQWPEVLPTLDLPLTLEADAIAIDALSLLQEGESMLQVQRARAGIRLGHGWLQIAHLQLDSNRGSFTAQGSYTPRQNFQTQLKIEAALPAALGAHAPQFTLTAQGNLAKLDIHGSGQLPGATTLALHLEDGQAQPRWTLQANTEALDIALLSSGMPASVPLQLQLSATGVGGRAQLQGKLQQGDFGLTLQPSTVVLQQQTLALQPLIVDVLGGRIEATGNAELHDPQNSRVKLALIARGLRWASTDTATQIQADADLQLNGTLDQWQLAGQTRLLRNQDRASVDLEAQGNRDSAHFSRLSARMTQGKLDASGDLAWAPSLRWNAQAQLAGFDPGYVLPDWPGNLHGRMQSQGETSAQGVLQAQFALQNLRGTLRQRTLSGDADMHMRGDHYAGTLSLAMGSSRLRAKGEWANSILLDADVSPLHLQDLFPNARGTLRGSLQLRGLRNAPDVRVALEGQQLAWGDYRADQLAAQGHLPWRSGSGSLQITGNNLMLGQPLQTLTVDAQGAFTRLQFQANAHNDTFGSVSTQGHWQQQGNRWQGTLMALSLQPPQRSAWSLQQPANVVWDGRHLRLDAACLQPTSGGRLCVEANWPTQGVQLQGNALPLALLAEWIPKQDNGRPWALLGDVNLQAHLIPTRSAWQATLQIDSASGRLRQRQRARRDIFSYDTLQLRATLDARKIDLHASAGLEQGGHLQAQLSTGWNFTDPLQGALKLQTRALTWMELLSPDIIEPTGTLTADLQLTGTRGQPRLGGSGQLQAFATEVPALGIGLQDGDIQLQALPDGSARIAGSLRTSNGQGNGSLQINGSLGWLDDATPLQLNVRGSNVLLADTRQLRLLASPDLSIHYRANTPLQVRGSVSIPEAAIHLEKLDMAVSPSADVVVLDPIKPDTATPLATDLDLTVHVGEGVRIDGYGLTGALAGSLRVRQSPGRDSRATGALDVSGRYKAYGQDLRITQGKLIWSNAELSDPLLDLRAQRQIGDVTAGVAVKGRASAPQPSVWSDPAMSQSEALAYLTLGRPLPSLSSREAEQINVAKSALNAGAGLLASQLGKHIGLDDAGVSQSRALGEQVLGVGKYLSPKLYVSYGVSMLGTGQVVTLKYLLRKGFDLQIESSTVENRASVNWRTEK